MSESNKSAQALHTPLYDLHLELEAKMVPFAGYQMPLQYPSGIMTEHRHTRSAAGLFDVSHMGQIVVRGAQACEQLESLLPVDLEQLQINQHAYTQLTNAEGGIIDDLIVGRWAEDSFLLVVNAACKQQDLLWLQEHLQPGCEIQELGSHALLALQGPEAAAAMSTLAPECNELAFMQGCWITLGQHDAYLSRSGYTGEDGFELSLPAEAAELTAKRLLAQESVMAIGLGARDSLRLEAGLCLYGHELNNTTTPVEAGLSWSISKSRRSNGSKAGGFPGASRILEQIDNGAAVKRVGLSVQGRAPVREQARLFDTSGAECGLVSSGGFGPSVNQPVAMGYVKAGLASPGTQLEAELRNKRIPVEVVKLPFSPHRYHRD